MGAKPKYNVSLLSGLVAVAVAMCAVKARAGFFSDPIGTIRNKIHETPIKIDHDLFKKQIGDLLALSSGAAFSVVPNADKKTYTRFERLRASVNLGGNFGEGFLFAAGMDKGAEIEFARQFATQKQALNLVKYPPLKAMLHLPLTAQKALQMPTGNYVRFKTHLTAEVGAGFIARYDLASVSGAHKYLLSGDWEVEVYRLADSTVLLRASALQEKGRQNSVDVNLDAGFELIPIKVINDGLEKLIIPTHPITVGDHKGRGRLFMISYKFNLADADARQAYDDLLDPKKWAVREFKLFDPTMPVEKKVKAMLVNFEEIEGIIAADQNRPATEPVRIVRDGRGLSNFDTQDFDAKLDVKVASLEHDKKYVEQNITLQTGTNTTWQKFKFAHFIKTFKGSLFKLFSLDLEREADALFSEDKYGKIDRFIALSFTYRRDDKLQWADQRQWVQQTIHTMLPEAFHQRTELSHLSTDILDKDAQTQIRLTFHEEALMAVMAMSEDEIRLVASDFIAKVFAHQRSRYCTNPCDYYVQLYPPPTGNENDPSDDLDRDIYKGYGDEIVAKLPAILSDDSGLSAEQRWSLFLSLKSNDMFNKIGAGLLSRVLMAYQTAHPESPIRFNNAATFTLEARAKDKTPFKVVIGNVQRSELYEKLLAERDRLLNREFDPGTFHH